MHRRIGQFLYISPRPPEKKIHAIGRKATADNSPIIYSDKTTKRKQDTEVPERH